MTKSLTLTLTLEDDGTYTILVNDTSFLYVDMLPHDVEIFLNDFRDQHQPDT